MIAIEHTHEEGTLIYGTERGDGSRDVLRRHRCRWSRSLGCWYVPQSRDRDGRGLESMAADLRAAGFEVELSVDDTARPVAEVQADRLHRSAARADGLAEKADRLDAAASAGAQRTREMMDVIPFGQPILVGHHSERRHRAHVGRIDRSVQRTAETFREAQGARNGSQAAAAKVARADDPAYIGNRIAEAERELRAANRGHRHVEDPTRVAVFRGEVERAEETLAYWRGELERVQEQLGVRVYARTDLAVGDFVRVKGSWGIVAKLNPKTVAVDTGYMPWPLKYGYHELKDHRPAASPPAVSEHQRFKSTEG